MHSISLSILLRVARSFFLCGCFFFPFSFVFFMLHFHFHFHIYFSLSPVFAQLPSWNVFAVEYVRWKRMLHTHIRISTSTYTVQRSNQRRVYARRVSEIVKVCIAIAWSKCLRELAINNLNITNSCWYYPNYEVHYVNVHRNIVNTVKYVHIFSNSFYRTFNVHSIPFIPFSSVQFSVCVLLWYTSNQHYGLVSFRLFCIAFAVRCLCLCSLQMPPLHTISYHTGYDMRQTNK